MKKLVYTLSFITLLGLAGKAQSTAQPVKPVEPAKQTEPSKKENKATITPAGASEMPSSNEPKSRMAITQKGVPASKTKENKDAKAAAEPKAQPTAADKH